MPSSKNGVVAQLGEHGVRNAGVEGSNPFHSTIRLVGISWTEIPPRSWQAMHKENKKSQIPTSRMVS